MMAFSVLIENEDLKAEISNLKSLIEIQKKTQDHLEKKIGKLQTDYESQLSSLNSNINSLLNEIAYKEVENLRYKNELSIAHKINETYQRSNANDMLSDQHDKYMAIIESLHDDLDKLRLEKEIVNISAQLDILESKHFKPSQIKSAVNFDSSRQLNKLAIPSLLSLSLPRQLGSTNQSSLLGEYPSKFRVSAGVETQFSVNKQTSSDFMKNPEVNHFE